MNYDRPAITLVVPVYNSDGYLKICLDSILNQKYKYFDVVLINDGSTDDSAKICDEYASRYHNFEVYHKQNGGVGSARNLGIEKAKTEWITFVDSDDYLSDDYLQGFFNASDFDSSSWCLQGILGFTESEIFSMVDFKEKKNYTKKEFFNKYTVNTLAGPYSKLFNLRIIRENKLKFEEKISYGEDTIFNLAYIAHIKNIKVLTGLNYFYKVDTVNSLRKKPVNVVESKKLYENVSAFLRKYQLPIDLYSKNVRHSLLRYFISVLNSDLQFQKKRNILKILVTDNRQILIRFLAEESKFLKYISIFLKSNFLNSIIIIFIIRKIIQKTGFTKYSIQQ